MDTKDDSSIKSISEETTDDEESKELNDMSEQARERRGKLFEDLAFDNSFTEMESLCMNCRENGVTRLLLTKIPFFKEVILMAFTCPHCGWSNTRRSMRATLTDRFLRLFFLSPFRCRVCLKRFYSFTSLTKSA